MALTAESNAFRDQMETLTTSEDAVLEELEVDAYENSLALKKPSSPPPVVFMEDSKFLQNTISPPESPVKTRRDFGNISPISELLDDDDLDASPIEDKGDAEDDTETADNEGKVTPEPHQQRGSFPRISDGRSSPILAYSPSLIKSPSSNNSKSRLQSSPPSGNGGGSGKRPRNIARMLDNISDHSSGEEEVNSVGMMMAKFTV